MINYASGATLTQTLASLAQAAARESTAIDNSSNRYEDAWLYYEIKLQTGSPASDKVINFYLYGSDGTSFGDNATGTNAAVTLRSPHNFAWARPLNTPDSGALVYKYYLASVAACFGGVLPKKWGVIVENRTNLAFDTTEGNHVKTYGGIYWTPT